MERNESTAFRRGERGSALILVLLLMLALSAIGMVALQNVTQSIERSGMYRVRTSGTGFSDGAASFWMRHSAGKAGDVVRQMGRGNGCLKRLDVSIQEWDADLGEKMNGCAWYTGGSDSFGDILADSTEETGLFTDGSNDSFEVRTESTSFDVVVRDPFPAKRPAGFSDDDFCFKNVTVVSEGTIGELAGTWDEPQQIGRGRTGFLGKLGPLPCDSE